MKNYPVKGRVVAVDHEIVESYLLAARVAGLDEGYRPIAGAKVYLAHDEAGERPVPGYEVRTDAEGLYELDTKDLPPSPHDEYGWYYLIIEKEGYRSARKHMGFGFMSGYLTNTVVLKPLPKD